MINILMNQMEQMKLMMIHQAELTKQNDVVAVKANNENDLRSFLITIKSIN